MEDVKLEEHFRFCVVANLNVPVRLKNEQQLND